MRLAFIVFLINIENIIPFLISQLHVGTVVGFMIMKKKLVQRKNNTLNSIYEKDILNYSDCRHCLFNY